MNKNVASTVTEFVKKVWNAFCVKKIKNNV